MDTAIPQFRAPNRLATLLEARAPLDWATLLVGAPWLASAPRGDGRPVALLPGYGAEERSLKPLHRYLTYLGYSTFHWGLGRNTGDVDGLVQKMGSRVAEISQESGNEPVTLIGWSLGGVVARETARLYEPLVREVITMGTPVVGGPKYTAVGAQFASRAGLDLDEFEHEVHARNSLGLKQPITSIYSRSDGVVAWRASIDTYNEQARNIEVHSSHFGLGNSATVWLQIAKTLARETD